MPKPMTSPPNGPRFTIAIIHPELLVNKVHGAQAKQSQVPGFSDQFSEAVDIWTFRLYKLSKFNWYLSRGLLELLFWVGKGSQQRTTMICEQEDISWPSKHVANPAELSHDHLYSLYHGWTIMRIKIQEPWMEHLAVCQNLVPLVTIKIAGKWMFIPLKMVLIGIDPYPFKKVEEPQH